jgi:iron-sulfur cluster assembly protein
MLALTPAAIEVVRTITADESTPEGAGLRIAASGDGQPQESLELSVAAGPEQNDQVLSGEGATVFLDEQAATYLDDKILDANIDEQGQASFALGTQSENAEAPQGE